MSIRLNYWQTLALFLPFSVGFLFLLFARSNSYFYQAYAATANLLFLISIFAAVGYQTYLALAFNAGSATKSKIFKWNALIPFAFLSFYLLHVIFLALDKPYYHNPNYNWRPMRESQFHGSSLIITLFLAHAFITFYFLNNQVVSRKIKTESDIDKRELLTLEFLIPMKRLVKISIWVFVVMLVISTIVDIVNFSMLAKN